ncbi:MAG: hypothetical protein H6963_05990 [Chromatiaceae bacterium]|nr:hypothetical protein [Chromatiaceae bacterium]MCP5408830.1 hypothetical protein [Chromatiaceae bacterium]MCP5445063.1 hypothetical protein [Chromatiaceae bacterium]
MTLERAQQLIRQQIEFGSGYNRHSVRLILGEVQRAHGQPAVDEMIEKLALNEAFGLRTGTDFSNIGR